jgi:hypothetical protein
MTAVLFTMPEHFNYWFIWELTNFFFNPLKLR